MQTNWFESFFQGAAVELWTRAMSPAITNSEVDFLEKALTLTPGDRVLDVPCGNGRHAIELARRGYQVTALDLSTEFLERAQSAARAAGVRVDWQKGDMRALRVPSQTFAGAYCFGNSFPYLDPAGAERFLQDLASSLRPGGRLCIDTGCCAESMLPSLPTRRWHRFDDLLMLSEARYVPEEGRLDIDYTFVQGANWETRPTSSYVISVSEFRRMLFAAGFGDVALHAGLAGEPYYVGSPRLIATARKT